MHEVIFGVFLLFSRADYWKSNERKYCDFCKCWIADNKVSVSLHENGKRHKENVAKKITEINKKSTKDHKEKLKIDEEMSKMEKNAMAAYLKDIESNLDITSQVINEKLAKANTKISTPEDISSSKPTPSSSHSKKNNKWQEAKSEEGHIYYWNTETNEAVWEPPPEGFVSIADLKVTKKGNTTKTLDPSKISKKPQLSMKPKKKVPATGKATTSTANDVFLGPQERSADPYGSWTTIQRVDAVDLQLPEQKCAVPSIPIHNVPQERIFKEKQVMLTEDDNESVGFKKRKFNNNAKRNTRQRLDDD